MTMVLNFTHQGHDQHIIAIAMMRCHENLTGTPNLVVVVDGDASDLSPGSLHSTLLPKAIGTPRQ